MQMTEALTMCDEAIRAAEQFPRRQNEYKGSILTILEQLRSKLMNRGRLSQHDQILLNEITLLTEKWVEG